MKTITLKINGENIAIKVSKWTKRPKANGIYVMVDVPEFIHSVKEALEIELNISIDTYINDNGLYIDEYESKWLEEGTIIRFLKQAEKEGVL